MTKIDLALFLGILGLIIIAAALVSAQRHKDTLQGARLTRHIWAVIVGAALLFVSALISQALWAVCLTGLALVANLWVLSRQSK